MGKEPARPTWAKMPFWLIERSPEIGPSAMLVLLALMKFADVSGKCFPKVGTLEKTSGLSRRCVQLGLKKLKALKLIKSDVRKAGMSGRQSSNNFTLLLSEPP